MKKIITIAIDGFSSTGKSTVAKRLAKALGYVYVDTGAMYRAVTFYAMQNDLISDDAFDKEGLIAHLDKVKVNFKFNENLGFAEVYLNGTNVEQEVRNMEVSQFVSQVATVSEVRQRLVKQQQAFGKDKGVVMDGRDIGTVVFPDAELKLFMTASAEKRAQRRYDELLERGDKVSYEAVLENVQSRDLVDSTRKDSPLVKAEDAIRVDNSNMTLDEQFEFILKLSEEKISA
ncbi:(d)CMP kinase [Subsaximicrobium wynnwilliamsii]|uniref:Cytidylate kinase n=1 Tax=Subsaximicrobium wynnwilliamsii TaxID=291179 RepID=A0A5C6ZD62_9FLAO|nr:(d)CMP kinase [Subsaximicrobium wynnwilliamsii]TXD83301.1 (d)CMP kinase [Subsaximicrobium wynnwilliamsii]TXD87400.1 (d)CMP kinase [Subsaximicrobium wynnwilliamsii]TXE03324.1 (d)CMP kinase [Subsaximicrobium wynnwilliamsii]